MSEQPIALKELYSDVSQLRALYSDSTANSKAAWGDNKPAVPTSARNAVSDASPLSARLMNKKPESGPQSARAPKTNAYSFCLQLPATARAQLSQGHIPEVPLPAPVKSARQPDSARPLATPRGSKAQPAEVADASPVKVQVGATDGSGAPYIPPAGTVFEYDGGSSVVLSPHTDPPSEKEVQDYGQWLGLDLNTEKDLMWLAKEALMAPLPPYWRPCNTQDGEVYYFNFATGLPPWHVPTPSQSALCTVCGTPVVGKFKSKNFSQTCLRSPSDTQTNAFGGLGVPNYGRLIMCLCAGESIWDHPMDSLFKRFVPLERSRLQKCRDSGMPITHMPSRYTTQHYASRTFLDSGH